MGKICSHQVPAEFMLDSNSRARPELFCGLNRAGSAGRDCAEVWRARALEPRSAEWVKSTGGE